ncbi:MAG: putative rane protein [Verrucomicrobiales bacterium]|nr:putative rane protein [Verrucomicrobiales bacterium]
MQGWVFTTLSVLLTSYILRGIQFERPIHLISAALLLGILNAFVRPVLMLFSLPLLLLTLGLFTFVINAFLLYLVGQFMQPHFQVDSFAYALAGAVLISLFNLVFNILFGTARSRAQTAKTPKAPPPVEPPDTGSGPIIDV